MSGVKEEVELEVKYKDDPFTNKIRSYTSLNQISIIDLDKFNALTPNGRRVSKYVIKYLNMLTKQTQLEVEKICVLEFGAYHETNALKVRRGIKDLIAMQVIANTNIKGIYWVNKDIIWK